jgi:hypothetical protein
MSWPTMASFYPCYKGSSIPDKMLAYLLTIALPKIPILLSTRKSFKRKRLYPPRTDQCLNSIVSGIKSTLTLYRMDGLLY